MKWVIPKLAPSPRPTSDEPIGPLATSYRAAFGSLTNVCAPESQALGTYAAAEPMLLAMIPRDQSP